MRLTIGHRDFLSIAREALGAGNGLRLRVRGHSMKPYITDGQTVTLAPVNGKVSVGDVVLVKSDCQSVRLHRVVSVWGDKVITRGDAMAANDSPASMSNILAKAVSIKGQRLSLHLRAPFKRIIGKRGAVADAIGRGPAVRLLGRAFAALLS